MNLLLKIFLIVLAVYILVCILLFIFQERLIFFPEKIHNDYKFSFDQDFEEINLKTNDQKLLHGLLFKSKNSKGLIFYLHGNAGSVKSWGEVARSYTDLDYDVFMVDYRGFGKSEGTLSDQNQLYEDLQIAYDEMKSRYGEDRIVALGYSIGTGPATKIASTNKPRMLILQAPYYSLKDMMKRNYPIIPTFILKYQFETNEYIKDCSMPIVIFHGTKDEVIYYGSSIKLKKLLKHSDTLIILEGQQHNEITDNQEYQREIRRVLTSL
ncbi:MAG TPA: alpha/beta fold hydrolase [Flavitalea sp.]|nr:alpha/beta fold hydrolase [Flavitalea sp.]